MILELKEVGAAGNRCLGCSNRTFARKPGRRTPLSYTAAGLFQRRTVCRRSPHPAIKDHSVRTAPAIPLGAFRFLRLSAETSIEPPGELNQRRPHDTTVS